MWFILYSLHAYKKNITKSHYLTHWTQQMSSSVSLDGGEIDNSERFESVSTSSANANEIVDEAIRHAVEGEVVRRQVASANLPSDDGFILWEI